MGSTFSNHARKLVWTAVGATLALVLLIPASAGASPSYQVVVSGLDNPRGLSFSADGKLYVAEAGHGGDVCFAGEPGPEGGPTCVGLTSSISRVNVRAGSRSPFIDGLMSLGGPAFAIGATGVSVQGNQVFGLLGGNRIGIPPPEACAGATDPDGNPLAETAACTQILAAAHEQLGGLLRAAPTGAFVWKADVGSFNYQWTIDNKDTIPLPGWSDNPDFQPGDSNPYGLASGPGGSFVVDGGANTLTRVRANGAMSVVAALPNPDPAHANAYDAVPTCVAPVGKGVVIADLNGRIFWVDGSTMYPEPLNLTGASLIAAGGCAYDGEGNVYLSDIFGGNVLKLSLMSRQLSVVAEGLNFPTGVAVARDGNVYVANNGVCPSFPLPIPECPGTGEVVRLNRPETDGDHHDADHHGNDHHEGTRRTVEDHLH